MFDDSETTAVLTPDRVSPRELGDRDDKGRFLPGNNAGVGHGRPRRAQEEAMLASIRATMPPERIERTLEQALQIATETNSWRGVMAVIEFAANYSLGKPIQRIEQGGGGIRDVMAELGIQIDE